LSRVVETLGYKIVYTKPKIVWVSMGILSNTLDSNAYSPNLVNDRNMILNSGMEIYELKDVINGDFITGSTPNYSENIIENGAVLLKTVNIYSNYLDDSKLFYISNSVHENRLKRSQLKKGDIILTVIGATDEVVGRAVVYNGYPEKANITQSLCKFGINQKYDNYYISTFINCKYGHSMILQMAASSTRRYINNADLGTLLIPIPSPEIQKYIGDKVRKAEELREEAKKLKKEAEGIIYKELNFGSLEDKLKIINNKYTWVGLHNLGIRIDSKYYNEKVLRIKDYFNKHYETIKLKECLQYCSRGKSFAESSEDGIILIKTKNLNNSFINYERNFVYEKEVNNNLILKEKDLIFGSMGVGSLGKIDMYYPSEEKATIDGTLMLLRFKSDSKLKPEYVMEFLRTHIGQKLIYQNVVGSTGIISISVDDLINIDIPYIDDEKQEKISNFTNKYLTDIYASKRLIQEAKQDVEDLIEGNFDMSKIKAHS